MKNYNKGKGSGDFARKGSSSRSSEGRGFNRGGSEGRSFSRSDRDTVRPEMHKATCAECGQGCEVPFKPISGRPILCSNCFKGKEDQGPKRASDKSFSKPFNRHDSAPQATSNNNISKEQFEILNTKLDKILRALE